MTSADPPDLEPAESPHTGDFNQDYRRLAVFAAVVHHGSMSAAARAMGMSTSAVSQQVRLLERAHGVTLLHRSTRKLSVTDAGARLAEHSQSMVDAAARARQQLRLAHDAPTGELRMTSPVGFARHVAAALAPVLAAHPALRLRLLVDDARIDLIGARVDLAVRGGRLADSTWAARRLCAFEWAICASPAYLARQAVPRTPADLHAHQWLAVADESAALHMDLHGPGGARETLRLEARATSNNQFSLQQLCVAGLGLALMPRADVDEDLQAGRLVVLLSDWNHPPIPVYAVTPQRENQPAKVRHAIAALAGYLATVPGARIEG